MNRRFRKLVLSIAMSMSVASFAQVADFSFAFGSGQCMPAVVNFTNTSTNIAQITAIDWDFGDGSPHATDTSLYRYTVQHAYSAAGTYTVTLTSWWGSVLKTISKTVTIYDVPHFTFSANRDTICPGDAVYFSPSVVPPTNPADITKYTWNFGDGGFDTTANPTYAYPNGGNINLMPNNVSLELTDINGCKNRVTVNSLIHVRRKPDVLFTTTKGYPFAECQTNQAVNVTFVNQTDSSTVPPLTNSNTYLWDFGDASPTSTLQNPTHPYNAGVWSVKLTATSVHGCSHTITLPSMISIINYQVKHNLPDTVVVCGTPANFTIKGLDAWASYYYKFGNGYDCRAATCSTQYTTEGIYTLTIEGTHPAGCKAYDTVTVLAYNKVKAKSTITDTNMCWKDSAVIFQDATTYGPIFHDFGKGKVEWGFGQGNSGATGSMAQHTYHAYGKYMSWQVVTTPYGCILDTAFQTIDIFSLYTAGQHFIPAPPAPPEGCVPLDVGVFSIPDSLKTSSKITDYIWRWDYYGLIDANDTLNTDTNYFAQHTYHDTGIFHVWVTLINQQGCRYDVPVAKFRVGVVPVVDWTFDFMQDCRNAFSVNVRAYDSLQGGNLVNVTNYTSPKTNITYGAAKANKWNWYDMKNPMMPIATGDTISLTFSMMPGYQAACIEAMHNGCPGQWSCKDSIGYLCPPIAGIYNPQDNADGTKPVFCNYPNFCDFSGTEGNFSALHSMTGAYNGGMKFEWYMGDTVSGYTISPDLKQLQGTPPSNFNGQTKFTGYMNFDPITGNPISSSGDINPCFDYTPADSLRKDPNFYIYQNGGVVAITLKVSNWDSTSNEYIDINNTIPHPTYNRCKYCEDIATQVILISDAVMNFTAEKYDVCSGDNVQFYDSSICSIPIVSWGFGAINAARKGINDLDYPLGYFVPPSKDSVRLPTFLPSFCWWSPLIPTGSIYPRVGQGFGLSFYKPNVYSFEMINIDAFGCVRADTIGISVWPQSVPAILTSLSPSGPFNNQIPVLCLNNPDTVYLKDSSRTMVPFDTFKIVNWVWNFTNMTQQTVSGSKDTFAVPSSAGMANITLTITNEKGCDSSITFYNRVQINEVVANFTTIADTLYNNMPILFRNESRISPPELHDAPYVPNPTMLTCEWDWGDGSKDTQLLASGTRPNFPHTYNLPNTTTVVPVTLKVKTNGSTCEDVFMNYITVMPSVAVTGISLSPKQVKVKVGDSVAVIASVLPSNATNQNIQIQNSNPAVAAIINSTIYALSAGTTSIIFTTQDGGFSDTCIVTVRLVGANISGNVFRQDSTTLSSGTVALYRLQTLSQYVLVDTASIGTNGSYLFTDIQLGSYILKAVPDSSENALPTYYGNTELWNQAFVLTVGYNSIQNVDITLIPQSPMNGSSIIKGYVGKGKGHKSISQKAVDNPAEDVNVYLQKQQSSKWNTVAQRLTNEDGYFEFRNVPAGRYRLILDIPGLEIDNPEIIDVGDGDTIQNIEYEITEEGINNNTSVTNYQLRNTNYVIYPNPTTGKLRITNYELRENTVIEIYDVYGKLLYTPQPSKNTPPNLPKGEEQFPSFGGVRGGAVGGWGEVDISHLANGMYFLKVDGKVFKVMKE